MVRWHSKSCGVIGCVAYFLVVSSCGTVPQRVTQNTRSDHYLIDLPSGLSRWLCSEYPEITTEFNPELAWISNLQVIQSSETSGARIVLVRRLLRAAEVPHGRSHLVFCIHDEVVGAFAHILSSSDDFTTSMLRLDGFPVVDISAEDQVRQFVDFAGLNGFYWKQFIHYAHAHAETILATMGVHEFHLVPISLEDVFIESMHSKWTARIFVNVGADTFEMVCEGPDWSSPEHGVVRMSNRTANN